MSLKKNITNTFFTQFPVILITFLAGVFITRTLGPEGKGIVAIFTANVEFLALFTGISINSGLVYFISNKKISFNKILGIAIYVVLFASFIGAILVFTTFNDSLLFPKGYNLSGYKLYLFLSFVLTLINTIFTGILHGKNHYSSFNKISIINGVFNLTFFSLIYFTPYLNFFEDKIDNILFFSLFIIFLQTIIQCIFYKIKVNVAPTLNVSFKNEFLPFFKYIGLGYLSQLINFFNYRLDLWFLNEYNSKTDIGYYSLAITGAQLLLMISNPISAVLFTYFSQQKDKLEKINLARFFSKLNSTGLMLSALILFVFGELIITTLYGNEFAGSLKAFNIMIMAMLFLGMSRVFSTYLSSENKVKFNLLATVLGLISTLIFNIILIPKHGIIGAAYSSLITYFVIFVVVYYKFITLSGGGNLNCFFLTRKDITERLKKLS